MNTFVGKDSLTDLLNKTIGIDNGNSQNLVIDNVPYCTAFDSCTEEDFFTMVDAAAASFAQHQTDELSDGGYDIGSYQIENQHHSNYRRFRSIHVQGFFS